MGEAFITCSFRPKPFATKLASQLCTMAPKRRPAAAGENKGKGKGKGKVDGVFVADKGKGKGKGKDGKGQDVARGRPHLKLYR